MYSFVTRKEYKELRMVCNEIIKEVQKDIKMKEYFSFDFFLVGSGSTNLITKNEDGYFDLDYNLILQKDKKGIINHPEQVKNLFYNIFNELNPSFGFKPTENNTSVLTCKLVYDGKLHFSFDVAILCEGNSGNYLKLTRNKANNLYYWNETKNSRGFRSKIKQLKDCGLWNDTRDLYLEKKNKYLSMQEDRPSFSILIETINEMLQKGRKK